MSKNSRKAKSFTKKSVEYFQNVLLFFVVAQIAEVDFSKANLHGTSTTGEFEIKVLWGYVWWQYSLVSAPDLWLLNWMRTPLKRWKERQRLSRRDLGIIRKHLRNPAVQRLHGSSSLILIRTINKDTLVVSKTWCLKVHPTQTGSLSLSPVLSNMHVHAARISVIEDCAVIWLMSQRLK